MRQHPPSLHQRDYNPQGKRLHILVTNHTSGLALSHGIYAILRERIGDKFSIGITSVIPKGAYILYLTLEI